MLQKSEADQARQGLWSGKLVPDRIGRKLISETGPLATNIARNYPEMDCGCKGKGKLEGVGPYRNDSAQAELKNGRRGLHPFMDEAPASVNSNKPSSG